MYKISYTGHGGKNVGYKHKRKNIHNFYIGEGGNNFNYIKIKNFNNSNRQIDLNGLKIEY